MCISCYNRCPLTNTHVIQWTLSSLFLVVKIKTLIQTMYVYFSHYLWRHMEHGKLAKILERKGLKIVHNVKTQWILMIALAKHVLFEYNSLVVKIDDDFIGNAIANLEQL